MDNRHIASIDCRVIVTRPDASEILLLPDGERWALPQIRIQRYRRLAGQLTAGVAATCGLSTYCLIPPTARLEVKETETACAVMEAIAGNGPPAAGSCWMPSSVVHHCCNPRDEAAIQELLEELDGYSNGEKHGPFARPGWLRELFRWAQEHVTPLGLRLTGSFQQLNASPTFSLLRLETNDHAVWFKATGEPNSRELPVTLTLARLFPRDIPPILGVHHAWNGWLSEEVPGPPLDQFPDLMAWQRAAGQLAELQITSIEKIDELLAAQTKDLRISTLEERIDPFLAGMSEIMATQEKPTPAPLVEFELAALADALKEACALHKSLMIPDTISHIDFNPGNILVCCDRCLFLDWAEAAIANPLVTFEYLREHWTRSDSPDPAAIERLTETYLRPWAARGLAEKLRRALTVSPLLAVFAFAVSTDSWRGPNLTHDPSQAAYFRSLTRRMYREVIVAAGKEKYVPSDSRASPSADSVRS